MQDKPVHVLLVEDNPGDANLVKLELAGAHPPFEVEAVPRLALAKQRLSEARYDAVLLDLQLPDSAGLDTVSEVRRHDAQVPIVVLSGLDDGQTALASLERGAQDYLFKGAFGREGLSRAIRYAIQRQQLVALLEKKTQRLTELYNTAQEFVDNVSHEFRTPLTVIKEFTSILRDGLAGELTAEQCRYLDIIADRVVDLTFMVNDMLDTSKLEVGLLGLARAECLPQEIVGRVRPTVERKAAASGITLEVALDADLPAVYCDPEKIGRVLINLVVNAVKFSDEGTRVRLWARSGPDRSEVVFGVSDEGPGISPQYLEAIFERFKQIGANAKASRQGVGLGLSIAKELVHLNFGTIHVDSRLGHGSTFSFTVPVATPRSVLEHYLDYLAGADRGSGGVSLVAAGIAIGDEAQAEEVDEFLQYSMYRNDLVFRAGPRRWLLVLAAGPQELDAALKRIDDAWEDANRNRPGRPLPPIILEMQGTWAVKEGDTELTRRFEQECHTLEEAAV